MRNVYLLVCYFFVCQVYSQGEFKEYDNGLIYSPTAISKLSEIVGDKNEEFRTCDITKNFTSTLQTKGYVFKVGKAYRGMLKRDIKNNISLEAFISKYKTDKTPLSLIVKSEYIDYRKKKYVRIDEYPGEGSIHILEDHWADAQFGSWVVDFTRKDRLKVIYIADGFKSAELPDRYKRMVQYSECLIDSTATVFKEKASRNRYGIGEIDTISLQKQKQFFKFVDNKIKIKKPEYDEYKLKNGENDFRKYHKAYQAYESKKKEHIVTYLCEDAQFLKLLNEVYEEALEHRNSTYEIETYVATYLSKAKALELKRNRVVVGNCSMDNSPRLHAMDISQLSAESYNWDVFLRAHLNIMNDRFERVSDGSYAWQQRHTYIKELEVLNINVPDLLLGMSLRVSNPSKNHYYGNISRLGRAIAESENLTTFEDMIIKAIGDPTLDDYNRLLMYYLYGNLRYHLDKNAGLEFDRTLLKDKEELLPKYLIQEAH